MKTNIILAIALASVIFLSLIGSVRCSGTVISISPSSDTIPQSQIGKSLQVNITISNVTNLWGWVVTLNWNPTILNFTNMTEGPFLDSVGSTLFLYPTPGSGSLTQITDELLENTSVNGNGTLATINFKVLAYGQSNITLSDTLLYQPLSGNPLSHAQIAHTVNNGQIIVISEFPSWALPAIIIVATIPAMILAKRRLKPARQYDYYKLHAML
jgi:hypothetical protein